MASNTNPLLMKFLYLTLLSLITFQTIAQNAPTISGIFKDQNGEPAPYVGVVLLNKDSSIVKTDISKENGSFVFPVTKTGQYRVAASSIQFKTFLSAPFEF